MYVTSPIKPFESQIAFPNVKFSAEKNINSHEITLNDGEYLFFAGDDAEYVYEVMEGVVKSSKVLADGRRQVLNFCYPGEMIGLSHDGFYHCDCDAVGDVRVRLYRKNAFREDVAKDPAFCARLLTSAAAEVNNMQDHFLMLGRKTAMEKIASFLIAILDRQRQLKPGGALLDLPMKRSDIADFLGMTIETVSRNFSKLKALGVIGLPNKHQVYIINPALLREMAENGV